MKKDILLWQFGGFAFTSLLGTLLHFLYDFTNKSRLSALISGINESTWEHMKLLFFPLFIFAIIESRFFKDDRGFLCIKLVGTLFGLILIPVLFYTINGAFGKTPDYINIAIFFVSAAIVYATEGYLLKKDSCMLNPSVSFILLCAVAVLFFVFTFLPPHIPIFADPISGEYGIV